jgi:prepilin-type N-terminal cleavage/methylation domain-containing protein
MKNEAASLKDQFDTLGRQAGLTLIELLVALLVGALAISIVLSLLKNAYRLSGQVKSAQESRVFVTEFVNRFHDDLASAGYRSFKYASDNDPAEDCMPLCMPREPFMPLTISNEVVRDVSSHAFDMQRVVYEVRRIDPPRSTAYAQEYGVFKTKQVNGQDAFARTDANELVLAGLPTSESFQCRRFINPNNGALTLLECSLSVYKSNQNANTETYKIEARLENF